MALIEAVQRVTALTIAGSDSSGGAGLQADLRAFAALDVHGASVVTLVTAQGTRGVRVADPLRPELVGAQLDAVLSDLRPGAIKTGALGNAAVVEVIADRLRKLDATPLVLDPVINPTRGRTLLDDSGFTAFVNDLLPLASLVVPNRSEASRLAGVTVRTQRQARAACQAIGALGAGAVYLKGGHFEGQEAVDLFFDGRDFHELRAPRLEVPPMHGLGCTLSAMMTALLARGVPLAEAVDEAHTMMHAALRQPADVGEGLKVLGALQRPQKREA
ncbi:MAG: bifunctional hydroxymethylpyrimidine kinase/phosphomethylpyrimidine kinase [Myxococcales bacterium]|nr:bifunctional hydroxymethylpyrimidine kinase/phosphomethylpyrimidine kinase [Myxococcales bacterium]